MDRKKGMLNGKGTLCRSSCRGVGPAPGWVGPSQCAAHAAPLGHRRKAASGWSPVELTGQSSLRAGPSTLGSARDTSCRVLDQAWGPSVDVETLAQTLPQNLFAFSIVPYAGFLYHLTKGKQAPPLTLFGFYFLLVFVFATIPAGIYAKKVYETSLANVDWLHGSAESLLTFTNLFIVIGLRQGIRAATGKSVDGGDAEPLEREPAAREADRK